VITVDINKMFFRRVEKQNSFVIIISKEVFLKNNMVVAVLLVLCEDVL